MPLGECSFANRDLINVGSGNGVVPGMESGRRFFNIKNNDVRWQPIVQSVLDFKSLPASMGFHTKVNHLGDSVHPSVCAAGALHIARFSE